MIRFFGAVLVLSGLAAPAVASSDNSYAQQSAPRVVVSCYRGPWQQVIWDHPNAVFVDSLVDIGYSIERAEAIADRICTDASLVNNPEALKATTEAIIARSPRG